jgi:hypothetical protein
MQSVGHVLRYIGLGCAVVGFVLSLIYWRQPALALLRLLTAGGGFALMFLGDILADMPASEPELYVILTDYGVLYLPPSQAGEFSDEHLSRYVDAFCCHTHHDRPVPRL